jgi:hypothetical protein
MSKESMAKKPKPPLRGGSVTPSTSWQMSMAHYNPIHALLSRIYRMNHGR